MYVMSHSFRCTGMFMSWTVETTLIISTYGGIYMDIIVESMSQANFDQVNTTSLGVFWWGMYGIAGMLN